MKVEEHKMTKMGFFAKMVRVHLALVAIVTIVSTATVASAGNGNTAIGISALPNNTGFENSAFGAYTLSSNVTGS
jgi:hypothetical protein